MAKIYDIGNGIMCLACPSCRRIVSIWGHRTGCPVGEDEMKQRSND